MQYTTVASSCQIIETFDHNLVIGLNFSELKVLLCIARRYKTNLKSKITDIY